MPLDSFLCFKKKYSSHHGLKTLCKSLSTFSQAFYARYENFSHQKDKDKRVKSAPPPNHQTGPASKYR